MSKKLSFLVAMLLIAQQSFSADLERDSFKQTHAFYSYQTTAITENLNQLTQQAEKTRLLSQRTTDYQTISEHQNTILECLLSMHASSNLLALEGEEAQDDTVRKGHQDEFTNQLTMANQHLNTLNTLSLEGWNYFKRFTNIQQILPTLSSVTFTLPSDAKETGQIVGNSIIMATQLKEENAVLNNRLKRELEHEKEGCNMLIDSLGTKVNNLKMF